MHSSPMAAPSRRAPAGRVSGGFAAVLWVLLAIELPFIFVASNPIVGDDVWWLLKYGQMILQRGGAPGQDPFTFTPLMAGAVNQPWLAEVILYWAWATGGPALLLTLSALLAAATFALLFAAAWERTHGARISAIVSIATFGLVASNLSTRAQSLAFPLFAACFYALAAARSRPAWLIVLPLAEAVWVNVHGSFPLGVALAAIAMLDLDWKAVQSHEPRALLRLRWRGLMFLATCAAALANPYGSEVLAYVQRIGANPIIRGLISEWRPPTLNDPNGAALFFSVAALAWLLYRSPRWIGLRDALLLLATGALAMQAVRNVAWWGLAVAPIAAEHLAALPEIRWLADRLRAVDTRARSTSPLPAMAAGLLVSAALLVSLPWVKLANPLLPGDKHSLLDQHLPTQAVAFARGLPPGRVFNYQLWGGYLLWELWPRHQVFGDSRIEIHPPQVWDDYQKLRLGHADWQRLLDQYQADYLFLHPDDQHDLLALAETDPGWRVLYQDDVAVILGRAERLK